MIKVQIQKKKFNPQKILKNAEKDKKYGALVSFIGSVREETNNGKIKSLFIEHYENMAEKGDYKNFMSKEIFEQPITVKKCVNMLPTNT